MTKTTATSICTCLTVFGERPDGTIVAGTCNEQVGAKARFRPGHDARTKGTLQLAYRAGVRIERGGVNHSVQNLADEYGYARFLTAAPKRSRKSAKPATDAPAWYMVKVGRWWRPLVKVVKAGNENSLVVYTTAKGDEVEARVANIRLR